jgi:hypothetical protein
LPPLQRFLPARIFSGLFLGKNFLENLMTLTLVIVVFIVGAIGFSGEE